MYCYKTVISVTRSICTFAREFRVNTFAIDTNRFLCEFCNIKINHE